MGRSGTVRYHTEPEAAVLTLSGPGVISRPDYHAARTVTSEAKNRAKMVLLPLLGMTALMRENKRPPSGTKGKLRQQEKRRKKLSRGTMAEPRPAKSHTRTRFRNNKTTTKQRQKGKD